jgi:hypothetical protein
MPVMVFPPSPRAAACFAADRNVAEIQRPNGAGIKRPSRVWRAGWTNRKRHAAMVLIGFNA